MKIQNIKSRIWLPAVCIALLFSCSSADVSPAADSASAPQGIENISTGNYKSSSGGETTTSPLPDVMLVRNGTLKFIASDPDDFEAEVRQKAKANHARITSEFTKVSKGNITSNMVLRVEPQHLDSLLAGLTAGSGDLEYKSISAEDVSASYVDAEARLSARRALHAHYLELLKTASSSEEIIHFEKAASDVLLEIETIQGMLNSMKNQVRWCTLNVSWRQPTGSFDFGASMKESFRTGWELAQLFVVGLANIWPLLLILSALLIFLRIIRRKGKTKTA